jgi:hypothetical protein
MPLMLGLLPSIQFEGKLEHPSKDTCLIDLVDPSPLMVSTMITSTITSLKKKEPPYPQLQLTIQASKGKRGPEAMKKADIAMVHWILANDLPHNTADDFVFQCMLQCMQQCGPNYRPPTKHGVESDLLHATDGTYMEKELAGLKF